MRFSVKLYRDARYGYWYICVYQGGRRRRWSTGIKGRGKNPPEAAEAVRRRVELALAEGRPLGGVEARLAPLLEDYLAYCGERNARRTLYDKGLYMRRFLAYFGDVGVDTLDRAAIQGYIRARLAGGAGHAAVNREVAMIKHLLNFALDRGVVERNAATRLPRLPERRREIRLLTTPELYAWFTWCRQNDRLLYDLSALAFNTGLRPGDILKIRGEDVNVEMGLLKVEVSKTGRILYVPINDAAAAVLKRRPRRGYIFPGRDADAHLSYSPFYARFKRAKRATGIAFRFYDFRHNAAVRLLEGGADIVTVQKILDHSDVRVTSEYYLTVVDQRKRAALQRLAARTARLTPDIPEDLTPQDFDLEDD